MPATLEQIMELPDETFIVVTDSTSTKRWRKAGDNFSTEDGASSLPARFFEGAAAAGRISIEGGTGEAAVARDPRPEKGAMRPNDRLVPGEMMTYGTDDRAEYFILDPGDENMHNCLVLYRSGPHESYVKMPGQNLGQYIREGSNRWRRYNVEETEHFFPQLSQALALQATFTRDLGPLTTQLVRTANRLRDADLRSVLANNDLGVKEHTTPVTVSCRTPLNSTTVKAAHFGVPSTAEMGFFAEGYFDWSMPITVTRVGRTCTCGDVSQEDIQAQLPEGTRITNYVRGTCPTGGA